jgi:D-galactose 1-dehydrogenase
LPQPLFVTAADLAFPANRDAPIAANVSLSDAHGLKITAEFDFCQSGPQSWDIDIETDGGPVTLSLGGARLRAGHQQLVDAPDAEYAGLYRRFRELTATGESDVDLAPLQLVADAFLLGRRRMVEPFEDEP